MTDDIRPIFAEWRKRNIHKDKKILRIAQGDDNLIVEESILRNIYAVTVFKKKNFNNDFLILNRYKYNNSESSDRKYMEIKEEF